MSAFPPRFPQELRENESKAHISETEALRFIRKLDEPHLLTAQTLPAVSAQAVAEATLAVALELRALRLTIEKVQEKSSL